MNIKGVFSFLLIFMDLSFVVSGQIQSRTWRDHLSYTYAKRIAEVGNKIFCSTEGGGMFSYNKSDNSLQKYSKVNGLSDINISTIGYSEIYKSLIICYQNGNIDLIRVEQDSIINIPDVKRKLIVGDKTIYSVTFQNNLAYLSCGFGIVVLDIQKKVIKDTYQFGESGVQIKTNGVAVHQDYLYAATDQGIYRADKNSPNLVDYNYWSRITNVPVTEAVYKCIVSFAGNIFALYHSDLSGYDEIIKISENSWSLWDKYVTGYYKNIDVHNNYLITISSYRSRVYDETENMVTEAGTIYPEYALYDKDNILWVADPENGLRKQDMWLSEGSAPDGPKYNDMGEVTFLDGRLWVASGNESNIWRGYGAFLFKDEKWQNFDRSNIPELEPVLNIRAIAIDPHNPDHIFGGSYGYGVVELNTDGQVTIYDEEDGVLNPIEGYGHGFIRVIGMSYDKAGNLWIATTTDNNPVYVVRPDGTWENLKLNYNGFGINTRISDILPTSTGDIWLLIERAGILTFRETSTGTEEKFFTIKNQEGDLIDRVFSAAEDLDGAIWVGTNAGPVVYFNPTDVIDESNITGYQILIPRNDGTQLGDFLLQNEKINCIFVDGANRKWIGTAKSGIYLVSEDGLEEVYHFTEENSPLLANSITDIAIDGVSGIVYIGTEKGLTSYKSTAIQGRQDFSEVYVYPNPVRPDYEGDIVITGLVGNVNVKITDITGNIVFETTSLGGQAIWDGRRFDGKRVGTGVYLIFCTNEDGSLTHITKLLVIN